MSEEEEKELFEFNAALPEICRSIFQQNRGSIKPSYHQDASGFSPAAELAGIPDRTLRENYRLNQIMSYENAETLLQLACDGEDEKNTYRQMEGYPEKPIEVFLEEVVDRHDLPSITTIDKFMEIALWKKDMKVEAHPWRHTRDGEQAKQLRYGEKTYSKPRVDELFIEMGFQEGFTDDVIISLLQDITLRERIDKEFGAAIHAMQRVTEVYGLEVDGKGKWIINRTVGDAVGLDATSISNVKNKPKYGLTYKQVNDFVAFFQSELGTAVSQDNNLKDGGGNNYPSTSWNIETFLDIAEGMARLYPQCAMETKKQPSKKVIQWGNTLDASIHVMHLDVKELATEAKVTPAIIYQYRNNKAITPDQGKMNTIEQALGFDTKDDFFNAGKTAQYIISLRDRFFSADDSLMQKMRIDMGLSIEKLTEFSGFKSSVLQRVDKGPVKNMHHEDFASKLRFDSPEGFLQHIALAEDSEEVSYAVGAALKATSQKDRVKPMPAEYYMYTKAGLNPDAEAFREIQTLKEKLQDTYPSLRPADVNTVAKGLYS